MDRKEFLSLMEGLLELNPGSLHAADRLDEIEEWDSLAVVGFLGMVDKHYHVTLDPEKVVNCQTVQNLSELVNTDPT